MMWKYHVEKLILEMLANRTPPSSIQANIVSFCSHILPGQDVVEELPCVKHIRDMRTVQLTVAKTLAGKRVGDAKQIKQLNTDETSKLQVQVTNVILSILQNDETLKTVCLAGDIIGADGTAEEQVREIVQSFGEAGRLLEKWRARTVNMYEDDPQLQSLLDLIPRKESLCVSRLLKSYITTDTCSTARKVQCLLSARIIEIAKERGITSTKDLVIYHGMCHNHVRNIWGKALAKRMKKRLEEDHADNLADIPPHLRISFDLMNLHRCIDKECNDTAHYANGHGIDCTNYISTHYPDVIKFPITRVIVGERQDVVWEACLGAYYLRKYRVKWLIYVMSSMDNSDNNLQRALFVHLTSREMIAQLRLGAVYYMAIVVPMRWLAGNTHLLQHRKWGEVHMTTAVDLVYNAFVKIETNGKLMLRESFVMNIFKPLYKKLPELKDYLDYYFEERRTNVFGATDNASRKLGIKMVKSEVLMPNDHDNRATNELCHSLAEDMASTMLMDMADPRKVTAEMITKLNGVNCFNNRTAIEKKAGYGIHANNDAAEGNFAVFDDALNQMGRSSINRACGQGMTRYNHDYERQSASYVTGRKSKSIPNNVELGLFHTIPSKLQDSLISMSKSEFESTHQTYLTSIKRQRDRRAQKKVDANDKKMQSSQKKFKEATWLLQQYNSPRCWNTVKKALTEFTKLSSHTQKLKYVKEQILMRYLGCGWLEAHHAWSKDSVSYTATKLLDHLVKIVIPLRNVKSVPEEAPFELPRMPDLPVLGTQTNDLEDYTNDLEDEKLASMLQALKDREREELMGVGDQCEYMNEVNWPNKGLKRGYKLEKLFIYPEDEEDKLIWVPGMVTEVLSRNDEKIVASVKWDKDMIGEGESDESDEQLLKSKWNPDTPKPGAWRQDLRHLMLNID